MSDEQGKRGGEMAASALVGEQPAPRLFEQFRARIRVKHYSLRTEQAYWFWIRRYILACGKRHPREVDGVAVEHFLTRLATHDRVSPATPEPGPGGPALPLQGSAWRPVALDG